MPHFTRRLETRAYRALAAVAARYFAQSAGVVSVHARRSVGCGEVVFGKSDIDLHLVVEPAPDLAGDARLLRELVGRYVRVKRLIPCLGDCDVSTRADLTLFYRRRPYAWYRDRAWLKLYGEDFVRPRPGLDEPAGRDSLLWWFFWAWDRLPVFFRAGNVRTCSNLVLDMLNAFYLYTGACADVMSRDRVLECRLGEHPASEEGRAWRRGWRQGFWGNYAPLLPRLYQESLRVSEALSREVGLTAPVSDGTRELHSRVPFGFAPRRYLLVDAERAEEVELGLAAMRRDAGAFLTTASALRLYLDYRHPWEYAAIRSMNRDCGMVAPPEASWRRGVLFQLHREIPRAAGFGSRWTADRGRATGFRYAQCELYVDGGAVAVSPEELIHRYRLRYGAWPYRSEPSRDEYCSSDYPVICSTIDRLRIALGTPEP